METTILFGLTAVILLGISAQWLAWRFHLPSILLLLVFGFLAGPVTNIFDPDLILGDLLFPIVSLSVAIILYEGGLSLRFSELKKVSSVVIMLITVGALVTWLISAITARYILGLSWELSVLLGAILIVTGPTVIGPILHQVRPKEPVGSILKWEGILIDPVGALLAVLVFEAILEDKFQNTLPIIMQGVLETIVIGVVIGYIAARIIIESFKRHWVPDELQNGVSLLFVIVAFVLSNWLHTEAGLLTVTLMGIILINQKQISVRHIVEFKENLRVLLISSLFILLAARIELVQITQLGISSILYLVILVVVTRPVIVFSSSLRSVLKWNEKLFISWLAPRGIVAAAITSVFAHELAHAGYAEAEKLVPIVFMIIVGTVLLYGLTAKPFAHRLGVAEVDPQGMLLVGITPFAMKLGQTLRDEGFKVLLLDSNWRNVAQARMQGLSSRCGNALAEDTPDILILDGIGNMLALTSNDEVNSLSALHYTEIFDRNSVYQLPMETISTENDAVPEHLRGRILFDPTATHEAIARRMQDGATVKATKLTAEFDYDDFQTLHQDAALPLFLITEEQKLLTYTLDYQPIPKPGQTLISLIHETGENTFIEQDSEIG